MRALFPADDSSPRFPQVLSDHDVATASYAGLSVLAGDFGVVRGFREERYAVQGWRRARGAVLIAPLLDRLAHPGPGPLFLYVHLMDAHQPYEDGPPGGTLEERYFAGIAGADAAVGRIALALSRGFGKRWALFVTADHGEAFGDHQTYDHAKTLYEELVHVPLLVRSPLFAARAIDERVGLIDLAPTILDLFGAETPATFDGQSLVPLLEGGAVSFRRLLLAEGRLRHAITEPDGLKVIDDPRRKVVEAYDLSADPGETRNLFDVDPARVDPALVSLRAFFAVHTYRGEGYEVPYRP
jgi:arylsulfatase A-like enzyme